jgi:hypothetical protein
MAAFDLAANSLGLQEQERKQILGDSNGQLERLGLFVWIFEEVGDALGEPGWWIKGPNRGAPFNGMSPLAFILEDPERNLLRTLQSFRKATGGWL